MEGAEPAQNAAEPADEAADEANVILPDFKSTFACNTSM
jgi:hypothetical protein